MPARLTELNEMQVETLRMVAQGMSNMDICRRLKVSPAALSKRLQLIGRITGTGYGDGRSDPSARLRLIAWAYSSGLMHTRPMLPVEFGDAAIELALDILADRPRGDLRAWAARVCNAAGVRPRDTGARRGRPVTVPDGADDEQAAA